MSDRLAYFQAADGITAVTLPFDYRQAIEDWGTLRRHMVRNIPEAFTRDEWAFLVTFLEQENLDRLFLEAFGVGLAESVPPRRLYRPRGPIAAWLPNNVSLLGPLLLVTLSLTGQRTWLKLGSQADDLAGAFLDYARIHLPDGPLRQHLKNEVEAERVARDDPRQLEIAAAARVRIVFGSDEAISAIEQMPHPVDSHTIAFADHQSEAWLEPCVLDDEVLRTLIRVFAIYGQAGCTSPRRVVLLNSSPDDALRLRDQLAARARPKPLRGFVNSRGSFHLPPNFSNKNFSHAK